MNELVQFRESPADADRCTLLPVTPDKLPLLQMLLNGIDRDDPYSVSAAYYAMTGRKGLWLYGDDRTMMIIARHPNNEDQLLFFPPFGADPARLLNNALIDPAMPDGSVKMARLGSEDGYLIMQMTARSQHKPMPERLLDWTYPVHVLDINKVVTREGGLFRDFRKNVNRAFGRGLWAEPITTATHRKITSNLAKNWADSHEQTAYSIEDLVMPSMTAIDLMKSGLPMAGLLIHEGEKPVGFIIWEETDPTKGIANSIAGLSIGSKGIDEFAMLQMCETLKSRGFQQVCIGGSETAGLDAFKRKMNPVRSIELQSIPSIA